MALDKPQGIVPFKNHQIISDWPITFDRPFLTNIYSTQKRAYEILNRQETDPINPIDHGRINQRDSKMCI